jgi:hypothetical protein
MSAKDEVAPGGHVDVRLVAADPAVQFKGS